MVGEIMQGLVIIWQRLPMTKRLMLVGAVAATIVAFSMLARTASAPTMSLLYSGLEPSAAGDVIAALEAMNIETDVQGNAIYVPSNRRDFVRMALAKEGLPQQGQAGYELLENLSGFSTTSEIFDVTYWRAMEGELARTILATPGVSAARVHIAQDRSSAFSRNGSEPKAVVTVTMGRGSLSTGIANSIRYLVSSSVPGLSAEQVAILDSTRGVVLSPGKLDAPSGAHTDTGERERGMESDLINLLEARVGSGNARVQVALELDHEREVVSERVIDPAGRVISGKETTEVTEKTTGSSSGSVSVASNLPEGDVNPSTSQTERTQTDETVSYDLSEIRRDREKSAGAIKRLSVAVLVNQIEADDGAAAGAPTPRSEEELTALRELVANAVGLDESRGDTLSVQSMPFKAIPTGGTEVETSAVNNFIERNLMTVVQIGVLSIVTLILGLFVVKPVLSAKNLPAPEPVAPPQAAPELGAQQAAMIAQSQTPIDTLKGLASDKTDETATLIKTWLEEETAA